ncbi:MAG: hypothetical protein V4569_00990 [Pseudomonadota bacterium]
MIATLDAQQPVLAAILVTRHRADANEPVTAPTALRQWKNDFR